MKLLLEIPESKSAFFLELLKNFPFVKAQELTEEPKLRSEAEFLEGFKEALEEVKLAKEGKIKLQSLNELLDEL